MAETAGHCPTCTCLPESRVEVGTYCGDEVTERHETFGCLEWKGHDPPHTASLVTPPCPICHGLDRHADRCPQIGHDPEDAPLLEVTWLDGQPIVLVLSS